MNFDVRELARLAVAIARAPTRLLELERRIVDLELGQPRPRAGAPRPRPDLAGANDQAGSPLDVFARHR